MLSLSDTGHGGLARLPLLPIGMSPILSWFRCGLNSALILVTLVALVAGAAYSLGHIG